MTAIGANETVIAILTRDHGQVERIFADLELSRGASDPGARERRRDLVDELLIELVRHLVGEESAVYPMVAERICAAGAERLIHQHAEAKRTMKRLDGMSTENPAFELLLALLIDQVRTHIAEEEAEMLPAIRRMFSDKELSAVGSKVLAVKRIAPLRPHPMGLDSPPVARLMVPIEGLLDRLRRSLSWRGRRHRPPV